MVDLVACTTEDEFKQLAQSITRQSDYPGLPAAFGIGLATVYVPDGEDEPQFLDLRFPHTNLRENGGSAAVFWQAAMNSEGTPAEIADEQLYTLRERGDGVFGPYEADDSHPNVVAVEKLESTLDWLPPVDDPEYGFVRVLAWCRDFDEPPVDWADAWLRLTLLSQRKMPPNSMNLDGIFGLLPNLAWTLTGPIVPTFDWTMNTERDRIVSLDKFPPMLDYVVAKGVRIADAARVRLGAHLAEGTTVMHEGFVNYNAGTVDNPEKAAGVPNVGCMIEGSISQGTIVEDGTDIGRGAGVVGVLSGGGKTNNRIGGGSLLGAISETGISVGRNCVVASGVSIMPGTKVALVKLDGSETVVKAAELAGTPDLVYWQNSETGRIEAREVPEGKKAVEINAALHAN